MKGCSVGQICGRGGVLEKRRTRAQAPSAQISRVRETRSARLPPFPLHAASHVYAGSSIASAVRRDSCVLSTRKGIVVRSKKIAASLLSPLLFGGAVAITWTVAPQASAANCENVDLVYQDASAFPDTPIGRVNYMRQSWDIEKSVLCLVNAERAAHHVAPVKRYLAMKGTPPGRLGLGGAASSHANAAVALRWWGTVAEVGNCVPKKSDPSRCDPHINPQTKSTPESRARDSGFRQCVGENTYAGWGRDGVTPRAALRFWMNSPGHRENILNPQWGEMRVSVAWGSADPAAGSITPALTYVQMFGCPS